MYNNIEQKMIELINSGTRKWRFQKDFIEHFKSQENIELSQSTVSRYLKNIKAKRDENGDWFLDKSNAFERNISVLQELFNESTANNSNFYGDLKIAAFKTLPYYNRRLAQKIEDTFTDEICCAFCPDDENVIVYFYDGEEFGGRFINIMTQLYNGEIIIDFNIPDKTTESD